mmetsp:Transcript_16732/g.67501  ORF Transcript_16732/g.67501 Transcript_16732/m.67501 type:complete len:320 (-) Transcript_16732:598-1557(-)
MHTIQRRHRGPRRIPPKKGLSLPNQILTRTTSHRSSKARDRGGPSPPGRRSAADEDHRSVGVGGSGDALGSAGFAAVREVLLAERRRDGARDVDVAAAGAQHVPQRDRVVAEEARLQRAVGRHADAVAPAAKVVRHRRDDADAQERRRFVLRVLADGGAPPIPRGGEPSRGVVRVVGGQRSQADAAAGEAVGDLGGRDEGLVVPGVFLEGHPLDEPDVERRRRGGIVRVEKVPHEVDEEVVVRAAHDDAVHLDFELGEGRRVGGGFDGVEHTVERLGGPARHAREGLRVDRVERHVDRPQPGGVEVLEQRSRRGGGASF